MDFCVILWYHKNPAGMQGKKIHQTLATQIILVRGITLLLLWGFFSCDMREKYKISPDQWNGQSAGVLWFHRKHWIANEKEQKPLLYILYSILQGVECFPVQRVLILPFVGYHMKNYPLFFRAYSYVFNRRIGAPTDGLGLGNRTRVRVKEKVLASLK